MKLSDWEETGVMLTSASGTEGDSRKAGFRQSLDTTSFFPLISTVKCLSTLFTT